MRKWANTWLGASVGLAAGLLLMAAVSVGQAAGEPQVKGKTVEQPAQGQQVCPSTPGGTCQVNIECPPIKAPGQTTCQATIDCPPAKQPAKAKKKSKTE
ncbi:MAG: hypothetical protein WC443_08940 [Desulfobaccales bacterium]